MADDVLTVCQSFTMCENAQWPDPPNRPHSKYLDGHTYQVTAENLGFANLLVATRRADAGGMHRPAQSSIAKMSATVMVKG